MFWLLGKGQVEAKIELEQEKVKDVTKKCWQSGQVEEKLDPKTRPALYIQVFNPQQEIVNKNESKRCRISVTSMPRDSQKALSLAIVHLENVKGAVHVIIDEDQYVVHGPALYDQQVVPDSLDYGASMDLLHLSLRHSGEPQFRKGHIFSPELALSNDDKLAQINIDIVLWNKPFSILMLFTTYRVLPNDDNCSDDEFLCPNPVKKYHFCLNSSLVCDGVPNCGTQSLPGPDEDCDGFYRLFLFFCIPVVFVIISIFVVIIIFLNRRFKLMNPESSFPLVRIFKNGESLENLVGL